MEFRRFDTAQLPALMSWFADAHASRAWGGADFRFPFTVESFHEDAKIDSLDTWSLVGRDGALAAFGQCYVRAERCHFGRLVVSPGMRGEGLGSRLIRELADWGRQAFGPRELSLFVNRDNEAAHRLYQRLGFYEAIYPESTPLMDNSRYMIAIELRELPG